MLLTYNFQWDFSQYTRFHFRGEIFFFLLTFCYFSNWAYNFRWFFFKVPKICWTELLCKWNLVCSYQFTYTRINQSEWIHNRVQLQKVFDFEWFYKLNPRSINFRDKNDKVFVWNDLAQTISEICGIPRGQIFDIKGVYFRSKLRKKIHLPWKLLAEIFLLDFEFFS